MSLSVCLVTRNEENNLPRVLGSVAGLADDVLVVDTGSQDRTIEVAAQAGARALQYEWHDDFSLARNFALDQARSDWILWLNPDEELLNATRPQMEKLTSLESVLGYSLPVQEIARPDKLDSPIVVVQPRLFRRHPELRYVGRVHPGFRISWEEVARREQMDILPANVTIRRHAYLSKPTPDKLRWSARLLEAELRDRPGQLHYLIEYGRTLLWLDDPRGHEVLAEAVEKLLPQRQATVAPTANTASLLEYLITVSSEQSRSRLTREEAFDLARRWFPDSPPLLWRAAEAWFGWNDFRTAAQYLERLLHLCRTGTFDHSAAFDPSIMGEAALLNLGICYRRLGEQAKAKQCFQTLLASPQYHAQAQTQLEGLENEVGENP
jgi:hypothetical protein